MRGQGLDPAGYYVDNDRSASNGRPRPEWERLLADVKAGKIDAIAAWDQDRGWRMMHELEELRKFFTALGRQVPLATTGQGDVDLYTPTGVMTAQIKTAVSEHEVAMMKVRMRRAARQKAEQGVPKWKRAFGYADAHQPDPVTAPLVKQGYAAVLAGGSITDVARAWNAAGAYGLTGKPWTASTVACSCASRATPGCAPTTARSSAPAPGRAWWTNPPGGRPKRCSTPQDGHRGARACDGTC